MSEKRFAYDGGVWDRKFKEGWGDSKEPELRLLKFVEDYKEEIGPKILDLGSGEGRHLIPLAKMGYAMTGMEFTEQGVKITGQKAEKEGVKVNLVRGDFRELPFKPEEFDTIVCTSVLHHNNWEGLRMAFAEAAKVLKPDGLFFLKARSDKKPLKKGETLIEDKGRTSQITNEHGIIEVHHDLSLDELKELAEENSLEFAEEPVDEKEVKDGAPVSGHWSIVFRKKEIPK